jgi:hypothetical protein
MSVGLRGVVGIFTPAKAQPKVAVAAAR